MATLYFDSPKYKNFIIFGTDIDEATIDKAIFNADKISSNHHLNITFFNGKNVDLNVHGEYDVIFANSVLCFYNGPNNPVEKILNYFTFSQFTETLQALDNSLKVGGLLAMVNFNYYFEDTDLAKRYRPLAKCGENFVPRVDLQSNTFVSTMDQNLDCVWVKTRENC